MEIQLNWIAIVGLGVPLIAVAFVLVSLFVHFAAWQFSQESRASQATLKQASRTVENPKMVTPNAPAVARPAHW